MIRRLLEHLRPHASRHLTAFLESKAGAFRCPSRVPTLVIAPHQDDETFGCGGLIALKRKMGVPVRVVFLTDGSGCHRDHSMSVEELVALREREAIAAGDYLGVDSSQINFLKYPDSGLSTLANDGRRKLLSTLRELMAEHDSVEIYVTHRRDIHPDHEAAYALLREAQLKSAPAADVFEYSIWHTWLKNRYTFASEDFGHLEAVNIETVVRRKQIAVRCYGSQSAALPRYFTQRFERPVEIFVNRRGSPSRQ